MLACVYFDRISSSLFLIKFLCKIAVFALILTASFYFVSLVDGELPLGQLREYCL